jgi:ABC-type transport system substrate-binding protein
VRRALAHAIDRDALIDAELAGRASLARSWVTPGHWAFSESTPTYPYSAERARALLDEAGLRDPDGEGPEPRLVVILRTTTDRARLSIAQAIAAMLGDVGIKVDVRPTEKATLLSDLRRGHFDLTLMNVPEVLEPEVLAWFFSSAHVPEGTNQGGNRWRFRSPVLDRALAQGIAVPDRALRRPSYVAAQHILAAELPVIPLWHDDLIAVVGPRARDFDVPRDGRFSTLAW